MADDSFNYEESLHTAVHRLELVKDSLLPKLCGLANWLQMKDASIIFNKWIFAEKATEDDCVDPVIPSTMKCKSILIQALLKGKNRCSTQQASEILDKWLAFADCTVQQLEKYTAANMEAVIEVEKHPQETMAVSSQGARTNHTMQIVLKIDGKQRYAHPFCLDRFTKLRGAYEVCTMVPSEMSAVEENQFLHRLLSMHLRYEVLLLHTASEGMQGALLPAVFDALEADFGVSAELYASPMNCTLPAYCSLFPETDLHFGSLGNVMTFGPLQVHYQLSHFLWLWLVVSPAVSPAVSLAV